VVRALLDLSDPYDLAELYGRLWEPHTPWSVYLRMLWELYGEHLDADENPNVRTGLNLTRFQADGVARMERLLDEHGGVLVADEVGLGKTYLAGEVIYRTANINRQRVLIVAPAALKSSMWEPFLADPRLQPLGEGLLLRRGPQPPRPDKGSINTFLQEVEDYSLVVIDEAHNLRNSGAQRSGAVDRVITAGSPKRVVLLTATPVNNSLNDLETLVKYFIRDDARFASLGIPSIREYIKQAQAIDPANLTPEHLFDLMDQVAVRRTRKFVKEHYANELIIGPDGKPTTIKFPQPKVRRIDYDLDDDGLALIDAMVYALDDPTDPHAPRAWEDRSRDPRRLMLARYLSSMYTVDHDLQEYQITNAGLLRSGLLKRLESSPQALHASLEKMIFSHESFLDALGKGYVLKGEALSEWVSSDSDDLDEFVLEFDKDDQIESVDGYHLTELQADVDSDIELLRELRDLAEVVVDGSSPRCERLIAELTQIAADAQRVDPRGCLARRPAQGHHLLRLHRHRAPDPRGRPRGDRERGRRVAAGGLPRPGRAADHGLLRQDPRARCQRRRRPRRSCLDHRRIRPGDRRAPQRGRRARGQGRVRHPVHHRRARRRREPSAGRADDQLRPAVEPDADRPAPRPCRPHRLQARLTSTSACSSPPSASTLSSSWRRVWRRSSRSPTPRWARGGPARPRPGPRGQPRRRPGHR
jgi:hypothetical protein